ncbi:hypothetical protein QMZ93_12275 [Pantoea stewartii subsp. indologenes]|uniref:hypothetical protein n=1 Tax=Pantoea TaxID=53335 RepID=UPI000D773C69|nr:MULTISPECIES: hypothetical protein [Pantoea]MDK2634108.1 hypothetical protein [Pantoea stewartii subsp. indologenes]NRH25214.1 hypothetical protein [Pantoea stewartii]PXV73657.1 hypothetical protein C7433_106244 [Pantoea sp. PNA 03-3]
MNNVIPLKRSEHVISDVELDMLANDLTAIATRYAGFVSLPAAICKTLSDALKRDKGGPDLISTPDHVIEEKFREKFSFKESISELQAQINRNGGYNFEALREEQDDGEGNVPA